jgi:cytochrome c553
MNKLLLSFCTILVASVTSLSAHAEAPMGDAKAGAQKNAMCIGCHGIVGYRSSFPEVYQAPKISGQSGQYIVQALNAYKNGDRKHPSMRGIAESLTDQDMLDLAAFYEADGKVEGAPELPKAADGSAKAMELIAKGSCASCHGDNFSKPIDPSYPKLSGQHADYLLVSLKAYKAAPGSKTGRNNAIMGGIVQQYSNAELKIISNYLAGLPTELKVVPQRPFR